MNPGLEKLQDYPFERLRNLKSKIPLKEHSSIIDLSIGEPKTKLPKIIQNALVKSSEQISFYPSTRGTNALRQSIADWLCRRFQIPEDKLSPDENILPVNGTREALFGISQALADTKNRKYIAIPNPFYQIYEGAALLAGAQPFFMPCPESRDFSPHFESIEPSVWRETSLVYVCSPNNPSGSILDPTDYAYLLKMADIYNFIVVADECYSEIYQDESNPPLGLLEWCDRSGRNEYDKCLVVNSLSKRSGVPGLRSGFVAGDKKILERYFRYRTYQGGAMSLQVQAASVAAWGDEGHVIKNRCHYRKNMSLIKEIFNDKKIRTPEAGFFLWLELPMNDIDATSLLLRRGGVLVLPGQYLARETNGINPGSNYIRVALVSNIEVCRRALMTIKEIFFSGEIQS